MTSEKREKAIKYLTEEIRSLRMAPQINGCGPENWEEQLEIMETCLEAVRSAHFAEAGKMQPLNFEQLRKIDGKPVRIVYDEAAKETTPWFEPLEMIVLVEYIKTAGCVILRNNIGGVSEYYSDEELQQDGLTAYAYPPDHIDREAWTAEWIYPESKWSLPRCSKCECNSKDAQYGHKDNFCPKCGRAMTPEAWAELEKRLRGCM